MLGTILAERASTPVRRGYSLCLFCGARGIGFEAPVRQLARELVARGIKIIYGGARTGLMGLVADEVLAAGGQVTGVIPSGIWSPEEDHPALTSTYYVNSLDARKVLMMALADAFLVLPGGLGTFDELFQVLASQHLGILEKPLAIWNGDGYFTPFLEMMHRMYRSGFIQSPYQGLVDEDCPYLLDQLESQVKLLRTPYLQGDGGLQFSVIMGEEHGG